MLYKIPWDVKYEKKANFGKENLSMNQFFSHFLLALTIFLILLKEIKK